MPRLTFRKKDAVLAVGGVLSSAGALLLKILPGHLSLWVGGGAALAGLALVAYGSFGITSAGRILNEWKSEILYKDISHAPADTTITIIQTSIPDVTRLIGLLEDLLIQKNKQFRLRLLFLDYEAALPVLAARVRLRIEKPDVHVAEIKSGIEHFIELKQRVDKAWKESRSGAQLDLQIRLYSFLPFGSVFQIGDSRIISGIFWNWTSSVNGPMLVVSDNKSKMWQCFENHISRGWESARPVFPPAP